MRQIEALELDDDDDFRYIAQVSADQFRAKRACDVCNKEDHLVASCPTLIAIKGDKYKLNRVLNFLRGIRPDVGRSPFGARRPSPSPGPTPRQDNIPPRPSTPTSSNTSHQMRQIRDDDESVESILQMTQDDASLASDTESVKE